MRHPGGWAAFAVLATAAIWVLLQLPVDIPDTNSPPVSNSGGTANDWTSVGQTFVPRKNGIDRVSVVLGAERLTDKANITFYIKDLPKGAPLRVVSRPISDLPEGNPGRYRPGVPFERWYDFDFEPIPDSAGRKLYFSLEGKDVPRDNTVDVLMFYHNGYPSGEAYLNEEPQNAHVVFRTYARGHPIDLPAVLLENALRNKSGPLGSPIPYIAFVVLYVLLTAALLRRTAAGAT